MLHATANETMRIKIKRLSLCLSQIHEPSLNPFMSADNDREWSIKGTMKYKKKREIRERKKSWKKNKKAKRLLLLLPPVLATWIEEKRELGEFWSFKLQASSLGHEKSVREEMKKNEDIFLSLSTYL